jgi:hypothetical protein
VTFLLEQLGDVYLGHLGFLERLGDVFLERLGDVFLGAVG